MGYYKGCKYKNMKTGLFIVSKNIKINKSKLIKNTVYLCKIILH